MSSKISKQELKGPDAFISTTDRILGWVEKHSGTMGALIGVLLIAGVGYVSYGYIQTSAENKAADALYGPQAELRKAEGKVREERAKKMQEMAGLGAKEKKEAKPESLRPVDYAKDFQPAVDKIKDQIRSHAGTKAAVVAALNLSYFLLQQKQYPEALAVLDIPTYTPSHSDVLGGLWLMHRGLTLMENQKYDEAAKVYEIVMNSGELKAFQPEAMLKLGVAYEQKGEADKARQTYEKLGREFPGSDASNSAQQYLRLLDLKSQKG